MKLIKRSVAGNRPSIRHSYKSYVFIKLAMPVNRGIGFVDPIIKESCSRAL